ncbi:MAG: RnfABCDGE type electron transport complex subunit B [Burkholderiales bacterium]|nr:RnfABCDGE type electron transport complex subunit B [Burkholderiales bacterium]
MTSSAGSAAAAARATALAARIDALLPQTQCTKCGYPSCLAYAEALAANAAAINRCPPGGDAVILRLAAVLGRSPAPLDPACGVEQPRRVATIDEPWCIGCTLCIQACPVDAIVGAAKQMHTVVVDLCTGCDLCVPPCPVDCIAMVPAADADAVWDAPRMEAARRRFAARNRRLTRPRAVRPGPHAVEALPAIASRALQATDKQTVIRAAVARARARRATARRRS